MEQKVVLDATMLRGLAHPLRVRILSVLRDQGPATATQLAGRLGQSSGATSYHLRQLATYGFVTDDPARNVGRERWWQAVHRSTTLNAMHDPADTEAYLRAIAAQYADQVDRWIGDLSTLPREWLDAWTVSDWRLSLTPGEAAELHDAIFELFSRYRVHADSDPDSRPDAAKVIVQAQLLPFPSVEGKA